MPSQHIGNPFYVSIYSTGNATKTIFDCTADTPWITRSFIFNKSTMQTGFKSNYQTTINAPMEKAWEALTNPVIVKQYFFGSSLVTDWKVGSPIYFQGAWEGKPYQDKGVVQEFNPPYALAFTCLSDWSGRPDEPENYLYVTYTLKPAAEGTALTITQTNYDADKAAHSEQNRAAVIDGLKKLVE